MEVRKYFFSTEQWLDILHLYGYRRCPHQHPPTRRLDSVPGKGENGGKKTSLGFVVTWSENGESPLSLVSCPSTPSEIIEETAESGSNDKTLPYEEQSEVPDGRGSEVTGGKDKGMFLHKPIRNGKQLTQ